MTIKIRSKRIDDYTLIRTLIAHPMETGRNKDKNTGKLIPAHYIQELVLRHKGNIVVSTMMGPGISKNPFFEFHLERGEPGDEISISWRDNKGNTDNRSSLIK